jgi:hypothetical protein
VLRTSDRHLLHALFMPGNKRWGSRRQPDVGKRLSPAPKPDLAMTKGGDRAFRGCAVSRHLDETRAAREPKLTWRKPTPVTQAAE